MKAHAERYFELSQEEDGLSRRDILQGQLKRTRQADRRAKIEAELALPRFPIEAEYLWLHFWRIRRRKGGNGFSASPIEWPDIDAFQRNAHVRLDRWEVETIEMLDDVYLSVKARAAREVAE